MPYFKLLGGNRPLKDFLNTIVTLVNELRTDHATSKTAADAVETLIEELHDDHATLKTSHDAMETLIEELHDDHATLVTVITDLKARVNELIAAHYGDSLLTSTTLSRGSTDLAVATTQFEFSVDGVTEAKAAVTAGTALAVGTIPQDKWGLYLFSIAAGGTITSTAAAANFTTGYASEAAAIAALPATPAGEVSMGYATVLTGVGATFVGGTDALQGGTGGTPSSDTNYVSTSVGVGAAVSSSPPATLTAAKPASGPATLTAAKPASGPATLSAAALNTVA